jgi:iron complex outermembrane recepter protein
VIRRKRNIIEMAVATAIFGACAAAAIPVSHAAQAASGASAAGDNGSQSASSTTDQDVKKNKKVANENLLQPVVISGFVSSLQNSIAIMKNSNSIVEAVSAEEIGKLPGSSIADALGRLPGVAMQEVNGRPQDITCHGMGPDFVTTTFDGALETSTGNNRGVEFDVYPSSWFKTIEVKMTPEASLFNQGMACTVDMQTIEPLDEKGREFTVNGDYSWMSPSTLMPGPGVSNQGHDVNFIYTDQFFDHTFGVNFGVDLYRLPANINYQGPWGYPTEGGNLIVGGSKNYNFSDTLNRDAYLATFEFRPSSAYSSTVDLTYSDSKEPEQAKGAELPLFVYGSADLTSVNTVNGFDQSGTFTNVWPVIRNDYNNYSNYQYNALWRNHFKFSDSWTGDLDANYNRAERTDIFLESYSGFGYDGPANSGTVPQLTGSFNEDPDGQLNVTSPDSLTSAVLTDPQGWGAGANLAQAGFINTPHIEDELANVTASATHFFNNGPISSVAFGADHTQRQKTFNIQQDFLVLSGGPNGCLLLSCGATKSAPIPASAIEGTTDALGWMGLGPEVLYNPFALIAGGQLVEYPTFMSSLPIPPNWLVREGDTDGYLQFNIDTTLGNSVGLRGNFGVQIAHTSQDSAGARPAAGAVTGGSVPVTLIPQFGGTNYTRVLPSLNLVFSFPGDNDARLSVARTMTRPLMENLNDSQVVSGNVTQLSGTNPSLGYFSASGGNPQLLPYMATNYNMSLEHYFTGMTDLNCSGSLKGSELCLNRTGYVQFSGYYLNLTDYVNPSLGTLTNFAPFVSSYLTPTQASSLGTTYGFSAIPQNNGVGHIEGLQLATNLPLGDLTHYLHDFGVLASANRTLSHVVYGNDTTPTTIEGLSKWVEQYTFYFQHGGLQASVSDTRRTNFLGQAFGISASEVYDYFRGTSTVDAQLSYTFSSGMWNGLTLSATGTNLGGTGEAAYQNGDPRQVISFERLNRLYSVGFSYTLQ